MPIVSVFMNGLLAMYPSSILSWIWWLNEVCYLSGAILEYEHTSHFHHSTHLSNYCLIFTSFFELHSRFLFSCIVSNLRGLVFPGNTGAIFVENPVIIHINRMKCHVYECSLKEENVSMYIYMHYFWSSISHFYIYHYKYNYILYATVSNSYLVNSLWHSLVIWTSINVILVMFSPKSKLLAKLTE